MRKYLLAAVKTVGTHPLFVFLASITGIWIFSGESKNFVYHDVISFILWLIIIPVIYGRLIEIVTDKRALPLAQVFKDNCFNYYAVLFALALPTFLFVFFFNRMFSQLTWIIVANAVSICVSIVTLFVMPLVFLRRQGIAAIPIGMKILLANFKYSAPLILLVLLMFPIRVFVWIYATDLSQANLSIALLVGFLHNLLLSFIDFVVFVTAVSMLTHDFFMKGNVQESTEDVKWPINKNNAIFTDDIILFPLLLEIVVEFQ